jgi:hypothetical protein
MVMTSQDLLNISLSLGFLILVGFLCWGVINLVDTLKSVKRLVDNTEDITKDVRMVKNQLKSGVLTGIGTALNILNGFLNKKEKRR